MSLSDPYQHDPAYQLNEAIRRASVAARAANEAAERAGIAADEANAAASPGNAVGTPPSPEDRASWARQAALDQALRLVGESSDAKLVLAVAAQFAAFVAGEATDAG